MTFQIRQGVPPSRTAGRSSEYPFAMMSVNTYIEIPADHPKARNKVKHRMPPAAYAAYSFGRNHGVKFSVQRQKDGSVRIYRIE
jgi:hypothetical protein